MKHRVYAVLCGRRLTSCQVEFITLCHVGLSIGNDGLSK